ncbi:MAG: NADH-quinone oxidoreductase subunit J [Chloroflexi bacterium]|nr:NADH-quinone oxidoreductase subunit J [Chloroflexota bacterium]
MDITAESVVFLILSALTLGSGLLVVTSRNLFHAALYLMLSLFGVAGLFALLTAPFLAFVQVTVYIGAIAILIIFAIMLTPQVTRTNARNTQWVGAVVVAVVFFAVMVSVLTPLMDDLGADDWSADFSEEDPDDVPGTSLADLGEQLVDPDYYMLPFEVASVLLMAALIGAALMVSPAIADDPETETGDDESGG